MSTVNEVINREVLRSEKNIFIFKFVLVLAGYVGTTLWLNAIRQSAAIWFVWVLIALQFFVFISIFVVSSMRAKQCGHRYQWFWLLPFLALSRVNNWELVVIPALVLIMLGLSERNQKVSVMTPEIGRHIAWTHIVRHVFRVLEFDRYGTTVGLGDTVKASSSFKPYGYLLAESPILKQQIRLPIVHRDDFLLAAHFFDEPQLLEAVNKEQELLVTYVPKHKLPNGLAGTSHALHYVITPRGTLDRYYEVGNDMHIESPAPEKLFGTLTWDGEIRVQVNPHPDM